MLATQNRVPDVLWLAKHGLHPVRLHFPIIKDTGVECSCGSPDCPANSRGKHPVGYAWGKSASRDEQWIRESWGGRPWNVGIMLGLGYGIPEELAIIDIEDDSEDGRELAQVLLDGVKFPAYSSGKSIHRLFRWNAGLPSIANMTVNGLELRFGGKDVESQSVAPPSLHHTGRQYQWLPGQSLDDIPIPDIPSHVMEWILEKFAERSNEKTKGSGDDAKKFRSPIGKIAPGGRHHALLRYANNCWRMAYNIYGFNLLDEQETVDQVWMWLAGANLLVCDPPKTERELQTIFDSSRTFMLGEIRKEMLEAEKLSSPQQITEQEAEDEVSDDRSFGQYLARYGLRWVRDPSLDLTQDSSQRIDSWECCWKIQYVTKGDEDLILLKICEHEIIMPIPEFSKPDSFARRVKMETSGAVTLGRSFAFWSWKQIWEGKKNKSDGSNGITRGLREYLECNAEVVEKKQLSLVEQVEEIILSLSGSYTSVRHAFDSWSARTTGPSGVFVGRLKCGVRGGDLITIRAPEDPMTGWYSTPDDGIQLMVKFDEVVKRYRSMYGNTLPNRKIAETMDTMGFKEQRHSRGPLEGRWRVRKAAEE